MQQLPKNIPSFSGSWSGDIEMQAVTISNKTQVNLSTLSADNRKLILKGINRAANNTSIFLDNYTVRGTIQVDGPVFITDGNSNKTYTWNKVTGRGNVTLTNGTTGEDITIYSQDTISLPQSTHSKSEYLTNINIHNDIKQGPHFLIILYVPPETHLRYKGDSSTLHTRTVPIWNMDPFGIS